MRFEKFTDSMQKSLSNAKSLDSGRDHTGIESFHILASLLQEPSNTSLLQQAGANLMTLQQKIEQALTDAPTITNPTGD
ncbi:Clp protease N-terminal domain-containing protein, partial [Rhizobium hidalgonense]